MNLSKNGFLVLVLLLFVYVFSGCSISDNSDIEPTQISKTTIEDYSWKADKFRGESGGVDVSINNWVYSFQNGVGSLKTNDIVTGDGFTYTLTDEQIILENSSEEHLPIATLYFLILNDVLYLNETLPVVEEGKTTMMEFKKIIQ